MQTTVWTQEMINDCFLPLQSLQRGSRIEIIQNTDMFLASASRAGARRYHWPQCRISQQHISEVHRSFPTSEPHYDSFKGICSCKQRCHLWDWAFSRTWSRSARPRRLRSAPPTAKPQKAFQTNAASYQLWLCSMNTADLLVFCFHVFLFCFYIWVI